MESVEREQDQGVINSREKIIKMITFYKEKLDNALTNVDFLKREISGLEERLSEMGESLKNERTCYNPVIFAGKNCRECGFYRRCVYVGKEDYGRFKL